MSLKDIVVCVDQSERASTRLRLAADLAQRHDAWITGLYIGEATQLQEHARATAELGLISAKALSQVEQRIVAEINAAENLLRSTLEELARERALEIALKRISGAAAHLVAQYARYADLCIVGQDGRFSLYPSTEHFPRSEDTSRLRRIRAVLQRGRSATRCH